MKEAIMSDDPQAIDKLKQKLASLQAQQEFMKSANKIVKAKKLSIDQKVEQLAAMGVKDPVGLMRPDFCGRVGYASYLLTNNNGVMANTKKRIDELSVRVDIPEQDPQAFDGFEILREDARIQFVFPGKPADAVRSKLKSRGFKWSPTRGAWVRALNANGEYAASMLIDELATNG